MGDVGRGAGRWVIAAAVMGSLAWLGVAGPAGAVVAASETVPVAGSRGGEVGVAGQGALSKDQSSVVESVSCASAGSCSAGGDYQKGRSIQGLVATERNGRWGRAIGVPGLEALNIGGFAEVSSVSCTSPGTCAAGGYYTDQDQHPQGFVAAERNGRWSTAIGVPGLASLNTDGEAAVNSVSCVSAGTCTAGGYYTNRSGGFEGFVAAERNGRWGRAIEVPGLGALNKYRPGFAQVYSVSCGAAGSCAAGGTYQDRHGFFQGFVAAERNGRWGQAIEAPGLAGLNTDGEAAVNSVSCGAAGSCAAGGFYQDRHGFFQAFAADERNSAWDAAIEVPGLPALNTGGFAQVVSVSCASAGNCAAGGFYVDRHGYQGLAVVERNGVWGKATYLPGLPALNTGGFAQVNSVSCSLAGNCAAGGYYTDGRHHGQGFVAVERDGVWGKATYLPDLPAFNTGGQARVYSVSCATPATCTAAGYYTDRRTYQQGFLAAERNGLWRTAIHVPGPKGA